MDKFERVYERVLADLEKQKETHDELLQDREERCKRHESNRLKGRSSWVDVELLDITNHRIQESKRRQQDLEDLKGVLESIKHIRDEAAEQRAAAASTPAEARKRKCSGPDL